MAKRAHHVRHILHSDPSFIGSGWVSTCPGTKLRKDDRHDVDEKDERRFPLMDHESRCKHGGQNDEDQCYGGGDEDRECKGESDQFPWSGLLVHAASLCHGGVGTNGHHEDDPRHGNDKDGDESQIMRDRCQQGIGGCAHEWDNIGPGAGPLERRMFGLRKVAPPGKGDIPISCSIRPSPGSGQRYDRGEMDSVARWAGDRMAVPDVPVGWFRIRGSRLFPQRWKPERASSSPPSAGHPLL